MIEKIGILGGTFDPFHYGHLGLAQEIREQFELTRVLLVPVNQSPQKDSSPQASAAHRLAMLQLGLGTDPSLTISDMEIKRGGISYSIDTLTDLHSLFPEAELFLILGADAFNAIGTWKHSARIMEENHIIVGARPEHTLSSPQNQLQHIVGHASPYSFVEQKQGTTTFRHILSGRHLFFTDITLQDISSREIRRRIMEKKTTKNLLPAEVEEYIIRHRLYQS